MGTTPHSAGPGRTLRADARRNRAAILAAAEEVFATKGPTASVDEVAHLAGVAVGTVFGHFATKEALVEAIVVEAITRWVDETRSLAETDDPEAAFLAFFDAIVEKRALERALTGGFATADVDRATAGCSLARAHEDLLDATGRLTRRAQQAGVVRPDVKATELLALAVAAACAAGQVDDDPKAQANVVAMVRDSLRP